jgi:pimeloyl-ACP methyl ester carboxylesterase
MVNLARGGRWHRALLLTLLVVPAVASAAEPRLESWDDDWVYPEGRIKLGNLRYSLVVGGIFTRFADGATRDSFSSGHIDPEIDLYRPEPKGFVPSLDLRWTGIFQGDTGAHLLAPTLGVRRTGAGPRSGKALVPFAALRLGPYFVNASGLGRHTVLGANATLGVEIRRRVFLAVRYDAVRKVEGRDFSTWSTTVSFTLPLGTPAGARQKRAGTTPPPGQLVDVGGYRLHLVCRGEGSPAVVLDAGLSDSWAVWTKVQPAVARTTRVCSYDRAGIGYSDPGPLPRTSSRIVEELHVLLRNGGVPGPYVLVGHSFGGYDVRLFASRYPNEVAGLVLVDAAHEDQGTRYPPEVREALARTLDEARRTAERAERGESVPRLASNLPPAIATRPAWYRALFEELRSVEASAAELRAAGPLPDVPLLVISAGRRRSRVGSKQTREEMRRVWGDMQTELVALSPRGRQIVARKSGHYVQREEPGLVADAIADLVRGVRESSAGS